MKHLTESQLKEMALPGNYRVLREAVWGFFILYFRHGIENSVTTAAINTSGHRCHSVLNRYHGESPLKVNEIAH